MKKILGIAVAMTVLFLSYQAAAQENRKNDNTSKKPGTGDTASFKVPVTAPETRSDSVVAAVIVTETGQIYDENGRLVARMYSDGWLKDPGQNALAHCTETGEYFLRSGIKIGSFDNNAVYDKDGKKFCRIMRDGEIRDEGNRMIGNIGDDGMITDASGKRIGSAPGIDRNLAVLIFFYQKTGKAVKH